MIRNDTQFVELIDQHQAIIHKICHLYRNTPEDKEDLFQEIVYQLWRSAPSFRGDSKFSTWLYRIALSTAINTFRKRKPAIFYPPEMPDMMEAAVEENEQVELLLRAMKQLNDADKALIALYLEDLSYEEIASITGITENHVGVKLNRIKRKLQEHLNIS